MKNKYKIISYFTPNYKVIAEKYLIPSLKLLNISYQIDEVKDLGSWKKNTDFKPQFIKTYLMKIKEDIVFIDVDATINIYPVLFDTIPQEFDIGIHYFDPKLFYTTSNQLPHIASGTIFIKNSENIYNLIDEWIKLTSTTRWEQTALQLAIENNSTIKIYNLPREYCYITTQPNGQLPKVTIENPIISHYQSSREMRKKYNG
jgi:hypothetical protein